MTSLPMTEEEKKAEIRRIEAARALAKSGSREGMEQLADLADEGSLAAAMVLARLYTTGRFAAPELAEHIYRSVGEVNPSSEVNFLYGGFLLQQKRTEEAIRQLSSGAASGHAECMYRLAMLHLRREPISPSKLEEIRLLLSGAADQGYLYAMRQLAVLKFKGKYGIGQVPSGLLLFVKAIVSAFPIAMKDPSDRRLVQ